MDKAAPFSFHERERARESVCVNVFQSVSVCVRVCFCAHIFGVCVCVCVPLSGVDQCNCVSDCRIASLSPSQ